jgi:hypothetical protein
MFWFIFAWPIDWSISECQRFDTSVSFGQSGSWHWFLQCSYSGDASLRSWLFYVGDHLLTVHVFLTQLQGHTTLQKKKFAQGSN